MHISEGVLSGPVLLVGAGLAVVGVAVGLRAIQNHRIPEVAVMSAAFFVASLVHMPVGPANVHLSLHGLLGLVLGWAAFPSLLVALALQALLFQFGGFTTLGVNTVIMAVPAVLCHYALSGLLRVRLIKNQPLGGATLGLIAGALAVAGSTILMSGALYASGTEFRSLSKMIIVSQMPTCIIEALLTSTIVSFLLRVKPELLIPTPEVAHFE